MGITEDNTGKFFKQFEEETDKNLKIAVTLVERDAKLLCPVKTGTLRRSITHEFKGRHFAVVGTNVEYAPHVELGTVRWNGKPFLRPALAKNLRAIKRLLSNK